MMEKGAAQQPRKMYNVACFHALLGKYLLASSKGAEVIREAGAESASAVQWLRKAVDMGHFEVQLIKNDADLEILRSRDDFKKVVADAEAKAAWKE